MNWLREPDTEPLPGYRLLEPIGSGGFGEVWKCLAPGGIYKAIKFVHGNLNDSDAHDDRARQELQALERVKQVRHPFLLSIEQIQEIDGELIIVMELADQNLHECFLTYQQRGLPGIPRDKLLAYLDDAATGLDYLIDKHGLQHLDVKPRNLFLVADRVKVADFGLVKTLERSSVSGLLGGVTPLYAAPETFANKISKHSDQYSLAIVYVELLTGRRPFDGKNIRQLALQHMTAPPDLSMLSEAERSVVARALAKDPQERFPSCTAFIRTLMAVGRPSGWSGPSDNLSWGQLSLPSIDQLSLPELPAPITRQQSNGTTAATLEHPTPATPHGSVAATSHGEAQHADATQPHGESGVLRPTLLLGIGSFGRRALQEIRRRLVDRLGDVSLLPSIRFLYVDCDSEATHKALTAPPEAALHSEEILLLPLQPVQQYRRRQLEQIVEWLPREKLYSIPRNLQAGGVRAFGRLAFCDHYLRFVTRLKRELHLATHPEALAQTATHTGLQIRNTQPQVFIFASLAGGSGGMLLDAGHAVRRILHRVANTDQLPVTAFVYLSAPTDPSTPSQEIANVVAGLTELHHYADPDMVFTAQYSGPDGPRLEVRGLPFTATYLLLLEQRCAAAFRRCLTQLASYVCNELTTPLGQALQTYRQRPTARDRSPFRAFGVCNLWYPRGLLLRAAAQRLCAELLRRWSADELTELPSACAQVVKSLVNDPRLTPTALMQFWDAPASPDRADLGELSTLRHWQQQLHTQAATVAKSGQITNWARQVWEQTRDWIGIGSAKPQDYACQRSRLCRNLEASAQALAEQWANECWSIVEPLAQQPGPRLSRVELAVREIHLWCEQQLAMLDQQIEKWSCEVRQAYADVQAALDACQDSYNSLSWLGGRTTRTLRHFVEQHRRFVAGRLQQELHRAAATFYRHLQHRLQQQLHEVELARHRLRELARRLQDSITGTVHETPGRITTKPTHSSLPRSTEKAETLTPTAGLDDSSIRILLPAGESHWELAAQRLAEQWMGSDLQALEYALEQLVLSPRGGLLSLCRTPADLERLLTAPLIDQTTAFLAEQLPCHDVAEVEIAQAQAQQMPMVKRIQEYLQAAQPPIGAGDIDEQVLLTAPPSAAGRQLAECLHTLIPRSLFVAAPGAITDILFCRENSGLRYEELVALLLAAVPVYQQACSHILTNPHARHDVVEWLPLWE